MYDLSAIFKNMHDYPEYELNYEILDKTIDVLKNWRTNNETNKFKIALCSIDSLEIENYKFSYFNNEYYDFPLTVMNNNVYNLLIKLCELTQAAILEKNTAKTVDLAECSCDLAASIAKNNCYVPKSFWKGKVARYRLKWDEKFLFTEQKNLRSI